MTGRFPSWEDGFYPASEKSLSLALGDRGLGQRGDSSPYEWMDEAAEAGVNAARGMRR